MLERHRNLLILSFRFLYRLRTVTPFAIGMSNASSIRFTLLNIIGALIWAIGMPSLDTISGTQWRELLGDVKRYEIELIAAIAGIANLIWLVHFINDASPATPSNK